MKSKIIKAISDHTCSDASSVKLNENEMRKRETFRTNTKFINSQYKFNWLVKQKESMEVH